MSRFRLAAVAGAALLAGAAVPAAFASSCAAPQMTDASGDALLGAAFDIVSARAKGSGTCVAGVCVIEEAESQAVTAKQSVTSVIT